MAERPEWVKCVTRRQGEAWCDRPPATFDWLFTDPGHALLAAPTNRLQPCRGCIAAIRDAAQAYLDAESRGEE